MDGKRYIGIDKFSDGKQARATGTGSQLGELLDHGVDAVILNLFTFVMSDLCGWKPDALVYIGLWLAFFTAHWEHYHTDCFYMGYLNACDGQNMIIAMLIGCAWTGVGVLRQPMWILTQFQWQEFILFLIYSNCLLGTLRNIISTLWWLRLDREKFERASLDLIPIFVLSGLFYFYTVMNSTLWISHHLIMILVGSFLFATLNSTLNMARVTSLPFDRSAFHLLLPALPVFNFSLYPNTNPLLLYITLYWILIIYSRFVYHVINEIAEALGIRVFIIKPKA